MRNKLLGLLVKLVIGYTDDRVSWETRQLVFLAYGRKCLACGSTRNIEIDHVVPRSWGGGNEFSNLQPLCKICNSRKSNKSARDYRR